MCTKRVVLSRGDSQETRRFSLKICLLVVLGLGYHHRCRILTQIGSRWTLVRIEDRMMIREIQAGLTLKRVWWSETYFHNLRLHLQTISVHRGSILKKVRRLVVARQVDILLSGWARIIHRCITVIVSWNHWWTNSLRPHMDWVTNILTEEKSRGPVAAWKPRTINQ